MPTNILTQCTICFCMKRTYGFHYHEGDKVCARCWKDYARINDLCVECGTMLKPIYENNGFTEPEGPSHWEVTGYEPCSECGRVEE